MLKSEKQKFENTNQELMNTITTLKSDVKQINSLKSSQEQLELDRQMEDYQIMTKLKVEIENLQILNETLTKKNKSIENISEDRQKQIELLEARYKEISFKTSELQERNKILEMRIKNENVTSPNVRVDLDKLYFSTNNEEESNEKEERAYDGAAFVKVHLNPTKLNPTSGRKFLSSGMNPHKELFFGHHNDINSITTNILLKKEQYSKVFIY